MAEVLDGNQLESTTVAINRTSTTVKGGRRLSFAALVVVGNRDGSVGIGYGKGRGVPHEVLGRFCASSVKLIPAAPGTGVIAGGTVRAVLEMAGIKDCLTKAYGSTSKINLCRAVIDALQQLRTREEIAALRGVTIEKSTVDEVLDANKRYMTETTTTTKKAVAPKNEKSSKGGQRGGRRPAPSTPKPAASEAAPPADDAGAATAVAEAPAPEAPATDAPASPPAEEPKSE